MKLNTNVITGRVGVALLLIFTSSPLLSSSHRLLFVIIAATLLLYLRPKISIVGINWVALIIFALLPATLIDMFWATHLGITSMSGPYMFISILFCSLLASQIDLNKFVSDYLDVTWFLVLFSISVFFFAQIFPAVYGFGLSYEYYGYPGVSFVLQNFMFTGDRISLRNAGFTSEPGIFQIYINLAVALALHTRQLTFFRLFVYGIGLFTANSTGGFLVFGSILLLASPIKLKIGVIAASVIGAGFISEIALQHYEAKILTEYAFLGRLDPFVNAVNTALQHPLGFGTIRYTEFLEILDIGSFDTYSQIFIRFGITGLFLWMFLVFRLTSMNIGVGLVLALSAVTNNVFFLPGIAVFLFVQWSSLEIRIK
jgi:hypothetical protein